MALIANGNGGWPFADEAHDIQQRLLRRSTRQSKLTQYFKPDEKNDNGLPNDSVLNNDPVLNMSLTSASADVVRSQPSIAQASTSEKRAASPMEASSSKKRAASPLQASSSKKRAIALPQAPSSKKRVAAPSQASRSKKRAASSLQPDAIEPPKKVRRVVKATKSVVEKTDERKEPCGKPLVWAEGRQALCEALPYYRSNQGASYHSDGLVRGLMLSHDAANRTYMDEEVIICRAAGGMEKGADGESAQTRDHTSEEAGVQSYLNNMVEKVPIIVIVAQENMACPTVPPYQYCVLDQFHVTDVWAEKYESMTRFFFRLEKINRSEKSWWAPKGTPPPLLPPVSARLTAERSCDHCSVTSKQIYQAGWRCLNAQCSKFFFLDGKYTSNDIEFSQQFLAERTAWPEEIIPTYTLRPQIANATDKDELSFAYSRFAWKGIVCPRCGRCNSRRHWDVWRCGKSDCSFQFSLKQPVLSHSDLFESHDLNIKGHAIPLGSCESPVKEAPPRFIGNWRVNRYDLCPGNYVVHLQANGAVNNAPGGSNYLFKELQRDNVMGLQRFPMTSHIGKGESLASHFAFNYGMPYKYVVATETKAFRDAPPALMTTIHRLNWAARQAVENFEAFNEILSVGYFEQGKMGYHDDGEKGLGPTVASLSLGGNAFMYLRMKERYFKGISKKKTKYDPHEIVPPGAAFENERRALNKLVDELSEQEFSKRLEALRLKHKSTLQRWARPILTMKLAHGDIVIQHGAEMQKYWEHSVVSCGKMRFALTARYIEPSSISAENHWKAEYLDNLDVDEEGTPKNLFPPTATNSTPPP